MRPGCINFCLTPGKYYYFFLGNDISRVNHRSTTVNRKSPGIVPALLIALSLHGLLLLLPLSRQKADITPATAQIEVQLTRFEKQAIAEEIFLTEPVPPPAPAPLPEPKLQDDAVPLVKVPVQAEALTTSVTPLPPINRDLEQMNTKERTQLSTTILNSQFVTQESVADRFFGEPVARYSIDTQKEFHYPQRDNLVTMLDQPMQKLPFGYTPGLIHFAYAPGVKGDLQRFWDTITPEFGWITDHGTEFKCKWVLVIAACGWK